MKIIRATKIIVRKWIYETQALYAFYRWLRIFIKNDSTFQHASDTLLVYRQDLEGLHSLNTVECESQGDLLPDSLVMQAGRYFFIRKTYDCIKPGVYRFVDPQHHNRQHVVMQKDNPIASAIFISFLIVRGNKDSWKLTKSLEQVARYRFLSVTCQQNCLLCHEILQRYGFQSRLVYSHTYEEVNSYNNAHVLLEVYSPQHKKFVVVDADKKCVFYNGTTPLSLFEYSQALFKNEPIQTRFHSPVSLVDWCSFMEKSTRFHYGFIEHAVYSSESGLLSCNSRICQVPMMIVNRITTVCAWDAEVEQKLRKINSLWQICDPDDFQRQFYDGCEDQGF